MKTETKLMGLLTLALFIVFFLFRSIVMVEFGTVKVVTQFGALTGEVMTEGLNFKAPWQGVRRWDIRTLSYETSSNPEESNADYTDFPIDGLTHDSQQVPAVKYTALFRIPAECTLQVAREYGSMESVVENVVKARSRNLARSTLGDFEAETLTESPNTYQEAVAIPLDQKMGESCVILVDFLVRKIDLDPDYLAAIELQQIAQEGIQTAQYKAEQAVYDKQRAITEAEGRKQEDILKAEAEAARITLLANAEAEAIRTQGAALESYPAVLNWAFVQQLSESDYMILPDTGVTPLIPLPPTSTTP